MRTIDFGSLRDELDSTAGLELTPTERDRFLNEGYRELACRAEWIRPTVDIGPTVVGQATYNLPSRYYRGLRLAVDGVPYDPSSEVTVQSITSDSRVRFVARGVFYSVTDSSDTEHIALYPIPTTAGKAINLTYVKAPLVLSDGPHVPVVDESSHRGIVDYACAKAFASLEDNPDLRSFYEDEFEKAVADLKRLRRSRTGRGARTLKIIGVTG